MGTALQNFKVKATLKNKMSKGATLKEIAQLTGFAVSTISKALRDSDEISPDSKAKIKEVANLLNFKPNKHAISLRSGKNYCIAVVLPSIEDPFYARVFHGIQSETANTTYSIITCISNESFAKEKHLIQKVIDQVDAFIIAVSQETIKKNIFQHIEAIQLANMPLVLIDRAVKEIECHQIHSDSKNDIKKITEKVFNEGYKNVVLVSTTNNVNNEFKRKGFIEAQQNNKASKYVLNTNTNELPHKLKTLIFNHNIDFIIAIEEKTTFHILKFLKQMNIKIPEQIALVGYMSENIAASLDISVTTINQHRKTLGTKAIKIVLSQLENQKTKFKKKVLKINSTLVKRQSFII